MKIDIHIDIPQEDIEKLLFNPDMMALMMSQMKVKVSQEHPEEGN